MMLRERRSEPTAQQKAVAAEFSAWKAARAAVPVPAGTYGMKCVLCGGPADRFTCAGCDEVYRELGL